MLVAITARRLDSSRWKAAAYISYTRPTRQVLRVAEEPAGSASVALLNKLKRLVSLVNNFPLIFAERVCHADSLRTEADNRSTSQTVPIDTHAGRPTAASRCETLGVFEGLRYFGGISFTRSTSAAHTA